MPRQLGYRLVQLRSGLNLTQQAVANAACITRAYLSAIENGRFHPPPNTLLRLARALSVDAATTAVLLEATEERRHGMQPLRPFFKRNPSLITLLGVLGPDRLSDQERVLLGKTIATICISRLRAQRDRLDA